LATVAGAIAMPAMASIVPAMTMSGRRDTAECREQIANFDFLSRIGCGGVSDKMASPYE
jgi:hypothetical protein